MSCKDQIQKDRLPRHVAIIMDGNGRWAKKQGFARAFGHRKGADIVHNITEAAAELGLQYLTLYTFSLENWNRPQDEVDTLMNLLVDTIEKETPTLMKNNVQLLAIGDLSRMPQSTLTKFMACVKQTSHNTGLKMVLALSYSSRWEILKATKEIAQQIQLGSLAPEDITEDVFSHSLTTSGMPDPDLLIRTSGELRISNFLLWQLAYAELYFTDLCWPEFTVEEFYKAIVDYQHRERRFGKTSEQMV